TVSAYSHTKVVLSRVVIAVRLRRSSFAIFPLARPLSVLFSCIPRKLHLLKLSAVAMFVVLNFTICVTVRVNRHALKKNWFVRQIKKPLNKLLGFSPVNAKAPRAVPLFFLGLCLRIL